MRTLFNALQIDEQREFVRSIYAKLPNNAEERGLPAKIIEKIPVSLNSSRSLLRNIFLFEFHPTLSLVSRLPDILNYTYWVYS